MILKFGFVPVQLYTFNRRQHARQSLHERGFSFLPLNKAKRDTDDTFTTLKRTPAPRRQHDEAAQ